jgi:hypothetical protein
MMRARPDWAATRRTRRRVVARLDDRKRDARARFEQRKRLDKRWQRTPTMTTTTMTQRRSEGDATSTTQRRSKDERRRGDDVREDEETRDDDEDDRAMSRGADLDELLRDAATQCLPRPRAAAAHFDASWSVDALQDAERLLLHGANARASTSTVAKDIAEAMTLDRDDIRAHLNSLGLARLLGLSDEYDEFVDGDGRGAQSEASEVVEERHKHEMRPIVEPTAPPKPVVANDDDWLDELLDGE